MNLPLSMLPLFFLPASDVQVHAHHLLPGLCSPLFCAPCAYLDLVWVLWVLEDLEPVELVGKIVVGVHHCGLLGVRRVGVEEDVVEVGVHHENSRLEHVQPVRRLPSPPPRLHVLEHCAFVHLLDAFSLTLCCGGFPQTAACTLEYEGIRRLNGLACSTLWLDTLCILGSGRASRRQTCICTPV